MLQRGDAVELKTSERGAFPADRLRELRGPLIALAREVGVAAHAAQKAGLTHSFKSDQSIVTNADKAADRTIVARLRELAPDVAIVSEEGLIPEDPRVLGGKPFWIVDPIDGTRGYAQGGDEWTVNIGLIDETGTPIFGIVGQPAVGEIYSGIVGLGAWKEDAGGERAIAVRTVPPEGYAVVISHRNDKESERERFAHLTISGMVRASSSLKFCRVAEGVADLYPRSKQTSEWDTAAGHAIVRAAGGQVFDMKTKKPLGYLKPNWLNTAFLAVGSPDFDMSRVKL